MEVGTINNDILELRTEFREALMDYISDPFKKMYQDIVDGIIHKAAEKCSGEFEEQTVIENLKEELEETMLYLTMDSKEKEA